MSRHRSHGARVAVAVAATLLVGAPAALAAKPPSPASLSGAWRGTVSQPGAQGADHKFGLDVVRGRATMIFSYVTLFCPNGQNQPGNNEVTTINQRLAFTNKARTRFVLKGTGQTITGTFSSNYRKLTGTIQAIAPSIGSTPCGTAQAADGTITNPPVSFSAKKVL